jgi:hypothetical protein
MHEIRLRKPWQRCRQDGSDCVRVDVPEQDDGDPADQDVLCYSRGFNLPTGLRPGSRVYLRIDRWEGRLESVTVNDSGVEREGFELAAAEITQLLQPHNQVTVRLAGLPGRRARLSGAVTLLIDDGDQGTV